MTKIVHPKVVSMLLIALVVVSTAMVSVGASSSVPAPQAPQSASGGPVAVLRRDPRPSNFRVPAPRQFSELHIQSVLISVTYLPGGTQNVYGTDCYTWPEDAKAAFNYAASIWASLIKTSVPIKINACWAELDPGVLGYGGAASFHKGFTGGQPNTWYPAASANALAGADLNDSDSSDDDGDGSDVDADMILAYSRTFDWYYGTDGNTPSDELDFVSVVLHEICHGLGFAGSMRVSSGLGYWGGVEPGDYDPFTYDRFTENGAGSPLLSFPNGSAALATQLTSNNLYFDGTNANAANGGTPPKLFAPSTWMQGSSYSHLDEIYNNTENALMTYALSDGESNHSPGPIASAILQDVGWTFEGYPDVSIVKEVVGGQGLEPGDPITFTLTIANGGQEEASNVVVADTVPDEVLNPTYDSTLAVTPVGGDPYVWNVEPLGVGESGVINIYGQIDPGLDSNFSFVNSATISDPQDVTPGNNTSSVTVGGHRIYLPLVVRCWPLVPYLQPIDNPDGDGIYTASWSWPSCSPSPSYYQLQGDDNSQFSSPSAFTEYDTTFDAYSPAPGTYYWRVRAYLSGKGWSEWSNVQSATVSDWFAYVWVDNQSGDNMTVEIVGIERKGFSPGYHYWRSIPTGRYTIKAWLWCGSVSDQYDFTAGGHDLSFWCGYGAASMSEAMFDVRNVHLSPVLKDLSAVR